MIQLNHRKSRLDDRYTIIYDTLDGLNWINGSIQDNLNYFRENIGADYYFERSFNKQISDFSPKNYKVYLIGLKLYYPGK